MATVVAAPRAVLTGTRPRLPGVPRRTLDTPTALTGLLTLVALLCVLAGTLGAVVSARSAGAARTLAGATVPAEVDAATIYTKVADADATAATAFLAGGVEPAALRAEYLQDIAQAGAAIARVGAPPAGTGAAAALAELTAKLPVYTGLIETARANNRQGFPVGGAYLSSASTLAQTTILRDADTLLAYEQSRVSAGYAAARSTGVTVALFLALVLLGAALIAGQLLLFRRTRRMVNLPLALATLLVLVAVVVAAAVVSGADGRLDRGSSASAQIALLTGAQIDALQEKGDESLTLVARGETSYEPQLTTARNELAGVLARAVTAAESRDADLLRDASAQQEQFVADHALVVTATGNGDFAGSAKAQAAGAVPFGTLVGELQSASGDAEAAFTSEVSGTSGPLDALAVAIPILAALALLLSGLGIRQRLREFR